MKKKIFLIEKYLDSELNDSERVEFEELLKTDPTLRKEFIFRKNLHEAIQEDEIMDLREILDNIMEEKSIGLSLLRKRVFYIPAAATVLIIVLFALFLNQHGKTNTDIFEAYYSAYPAFFCTRSGEGRDSLRQAFTYYENKQYVKSYSLFMELAEADSTNMMARFYGSICALEINQTDKSIGILNDLMQDSTHLFWEEAHWYAALGYIQKNETNKAKVVLNKITKNKMNHEGQARQILKVLK